MAYNSDSNYGNKTVNQPGGGKNATIRTITNVSNPERSRKIVTQPCRLGPAKLGGNPARKLNPYR